MWLNVGASGQDAPAQLWDPIKMAELIQYRPALATSSPYISFIELFSHRVRHVVYACIPAPASDSIRCLSHSEKTIAEVVTTLWPVRLRRFP